MTLTPQERFERILEASAEIERLFAVIQRHRELMPQNAPRRFKGLETVRNTVCKAYGVPVHSVVSQSRLSEVVRARHVGIAIAFELLPLKRIEVGLGFDRCADSVTHANGTVSDLLATDKDFAEEFAEIREKTVAALAPKIDEGVEA